MGKTKLKGTIHKTIIIYSPSCRSKPVCCLKRMHFEKKIITTTLEIFKIVSTNLINNIYKGYFMTEFPFSTELLL